MRENGEKKVLVYCRMWNKQFFTELGELVFEDTDIITYSDFKGVGDVWTGEFLYKNSKQNNCPSNEEFEDIYIRCRYLRTLSKEKARRQVNSVYNGLYTLLVEKKIDAVLMPIIDCYTMDILERVARRLEIPVISFVQNFIKGYSRFTIRGERIDINDSIKESEVNQVFKLLSREDYRPGFALNKKVGYKELLFRCIRAQLKYRIYYLYKIITTKDPDNYHYNTPTPDYFFKTVRSIKYAGYSKISDLSPETYNKSVYLPLHYYPEGTVDYWESGKIDEDYEKQIISLLKKSSPDITIIIKEHPAMYGRRRIEFYEDICNFKNVVLIHPYENSNELLNKVSTVVVHTGSVGVEALIRQKRVLCLTDNYYCDIHPNAHRVDAVNEEELSIPIVEINQKDFIRKLLTGMIPYKYSAGWNVVEESGDIEILAYWCKKLYCTLEEKNERSKKQFNY